MPAPDEGLAAALADVDRALAAATTACAAIPGAIAEVTLPAATQTLRTAVGDVQALLDGEWERSKHLERLIEEYVEVGSDAHGTAVQQIENALRRLTKALTTIRAIASPDELPPIFPFFRGSVLASSISMPLGERLRTIGVIAGKALGPLSRLKRQVAEGLSLGRKTKEGEP